MTAPPAFRSPVRCIVTVIATMMLAGGASPLRAQAPQGGQPVAEQADDPEAARVLQSARQQLAIGRQEAAQRTFEQLIARFPASRAATDARRHLLAIYANDRAITGMPEVAGGVTASPLPQAPVPQPPLPQAGLQQPVAATRQPEVASTGWRTSMISFRRPQDELRNAIGDRIFFGAGSADLGTRARAVITAQAEWLNARPGLVILVEGHADDAAVGADDEAMSLNRASIVRDMLVAEGVGAERIGVAPQGARAPVAICADSDCAAQNRRAVLLVGVPQSQFP